MSALETLFLLDLDSVLRTWARTFPKGEDLLPLPLLGARTPRRQPLVADDAASPAAGYPPDPTCLVVLGFDANAAAGLWTGLDRRNVPLTFAWLGRFAASVAGRFGIDPDAVALEPALTLPAPQSVDVALHRLLQRAGAPFGIGEPTEVRVLSWDRGLHRSIGSRLVGRGWVAANNVAGEGLKRWSCNTGRPFTRSLHEPFELNGPGQPPPSQPSAQVLTDEHAVWVRGRRAEVGGARTLRQVAERVLYRRPHLVSQLGLTRMTTCGVSRLAWLAAEGRVPGLHDVDRGDAVEVETAAGLADVISGATPSPIGCGAVRLEGAEVTVRSRIPAAAIAAVIAIDNRVFDYGPQVDDPWTVSQLAPGEVVSEGHQVALGTGHPPRDVRHGRRRAKASLVASVASLPEQGPDAWWFLEMSAGRKTYWNRRSDYRVPMFEDRLIVKQLTVQASLARERTRAELILVAPFGSEVEVVPSTRIRRGMIGEGAASQGASVAIFALRDAVPGGRPVRCRAIQALGPHDFPKNMAPAERLGLCRLPLLVPVSEGSPSDNSSAPVTTTTEN